MKWTAIAGTWKVADDAVERDVRATVREIVARGDGVATGGALGVDQIATDEILGLDVAGSHIKIFLPATLERYTRHYRARAGEGVITSEQAESLIHQLEEVHATNAEAIVESIIERPIDKTSYFDRITDIVNASDELVAFQVNKSAGTQDTIDKMRKRGLPVRVFEYSIE